MLSWVLRHRHQLRALYGLPPERALAEFLALEADRAAAEGLPDVEAPPSVRRGKLPQVVLAPRARRR